MIIKLNSKKAEELYNFVLGMINFNIDDIKQQCISKEQYQKLPWWTKMFVLTEDKLNCKNGSILFQNTYVKRYQTLCIFKKEIIQKLNMIKISDSVNIDTEEDRSFLDIVDSFLKP